MKIERFEDLEIWQDARQLCKQVFQLTSQEPFVRDYKFRDQIRSAAGSVMDNIAEGFGRGGNKEFVNFLSISKGSNDEARSQAYRAFDFRYIDELSFNDLLEITDKISKKTSNLILHLNNSQFRGPKFNR